MIFGGKNLLLLEQEGIVAGASQRRTITALALPRSNQNEATLFD
jgi:hypothetical protein